MSSTHAAIYSDAQYQQSLLASVAGDVSVARQVVEAGVQYQIQQQVRQSVDGVLKERLQLIDDQLTASAIAGAVKAQVSAAVSTLLQQHDDILQLAKHTITTATRSELQHLSRLVKQSQAKQTNGSTAARTKLQIVTPPAHDGSASPQRHKYSYNTPKHSPTSSTSSTYSSPYTPTQIPGDDVTTGRHREIDGSLAGFALTRYATPRQSPIPLADKAHGQSSSATVQPLLLHRANSLQALPKASISRSSSAANTTVLRRVLSTESALWQQQPQTQRLKPWRQVSQLRPPDVSAKEFIMRSGGIDELVNILSFIDVYELYATITRINRRLFAASYDQRLYQRWRGHLRLHVTPDSMQQISLLLHRFTHITSLQFGPHVSDQVLAALDDSVASGTFQQHAVDVQTTDLQSTLTLLPHLATISLAGCVHITAECMLHTQSRVFAKLTHLDLTRCSLLTDQAIAHLLQQCPSVRTLILNNTAVGLLAVRALADTSTQLEHIELSSCRNVNDALLLELAVCTQHLEVLKLVDDWSITTVGIQHIALNAKSLHTIDLSQCHSAVTDSSLHYLARGATQLQHLILNGCTVTDTALSYFVYACPDLQSIRTSSSAVTSTTLSTQTLSNLAAYCTELRELDFTGCTSLTDSGIQALARQASSLTSLNLARCTSLTDAALQYLSDACSRTAAQLQWLDLQQVWNITDTGAIALLKMQRLKHLSLAQCLHVTDKFVNAWSKVLRARQPAHGIVLLELIDLSACSITDRSLQNLVDISYPQLHTLRLAGCRYVTDAGLEQVAATFSQLEELPLANCSKLTDRSVIKLSRHCGALRLVDLTNCELLTNDAIIALVNGCGRVQQLSLDGCTAITDDAVVNIAARCFYMQSLSINRCSQLTLQSIQHLVNSVACKLTVQSLNVSQIPAINQLAEELGLAGEERLYHYQAEPTAVDPRYVSADATLLQRYMARLRQRGCTVVL